MADTPDQQPIDFAQAAAERRWERETSPSAHLPEDALRNALRQMADEPTDGVMRRHAIVVWACEYDDGSSRTWFANAGALSPLAQLGMLERTKSMLGKTE